LDEIHAHHVARGLVNILGLDVRVELARLAANLNQLTRLANEGGRVKVASALLTSMAIEAKRLRLALLGIGEAGDDR
jgi:hypothetical protein